MIMPMRGYNYDIESWKIAADIMLHGGNVYGETGRYNYGPIWFNILHLLDSIPGTSPGNFLAFRWKVATFLSAVDIGIFLILLRQNNLIIAALFFLSPISIVITGYHSQMDNFAILLGMLAIFLLEFRRKISFWPALLLLGLSLSTKHILFFFPLWMAFKEKRWSHKLLILFVPYLIFVSLFIPFWELGYKGILDNVLFYRSMNNAPFWNIFLPELVLQYIPPILFFFGILFLLGLAWRKKTNFETYYLYLIAVVVFSSAIANQYLAIPTSAIATQWNWLYTLYTLYTTVFLMVDWVGLSIGLMQKVLSWDGQGGYKPAIILLFFGLLWHIYPRSLKFNLLHWGGCFISWLKAELKYQLKSPW